MAWFFARLSRQKHATAAPYVSYPIVRKCACGFVPGLGDLLSWSKAEYRYQQSRSVIALRAPSLSKCSFQPCSQLQIDAARILDACRRRWRSGAYFMKRHLHAVFDGLLDKDPSRE